MLTNEEQKKNKYRNKIKTKSKSYLYPILCYNIQTQTVYEINKFFFVTYHNTNCLNVIDWNSNKIRQLENKKNQTESKFAFETYYNRTCQNVLNCRFDKTRHKKSNTKQLSFETGHNENLHYLKSSWAETRRFQHIQKKFKLS